MPCQFAVWFDTSDCTWQSRYSARTPSCVSVYSPFDSESVLKEQPILALSGALDKLRVHCFDGTSDSCASWQRHCWTKWSLPYAILDWKTCRGNKVAARLQSSLRSTSEMICLLLSSAPVYRLAAEVNGPVSVKGWNPVNKLSTANQLMALVSDLTGASATTSRSIPVPSVSSCWVFLVSTRKKVKPSL
jgi:hypothetical protein